LAQVQVFRVMFAIHHEVASRDNADEDIAAPAASHPTGSCVHEKAAGPAASRPTESCFDEKFAAPPTPDPTDDLVRPNKCLDEVASESSKHLLGFSFIDMKAADEDGISRSSLQTFISNQPGWLARFGAPNALDLFRRMDRNRDGIVSVAEFDQWIERFARATQPDAATCRFCPRATFVPEHVPSNLRRKPFAQSDVVCCLMCESSQGTAGHDMYCTGVASAPAGCIFEKQNARSTGAKLVPCDLHVGQQVESRSELRFGRGQVVNKGCLGVVMQLDDGVLVDWDTEGLRGKYCRTPTYEIAVAAKQLNEGVKEEAEPVRSWVLSVRYHGEYDDRVYREHHNYFDDAYLFGGPAHWPDQVAGAIRCRFNPNHSSPQRCAANCLGRQAECSKFILADNGEPARECCAASAWRWFVQHDGGYVLQVVEKGGVSPEQELHQQILEDLCLQGLPIVTRSLHLHGPLKFEYAQSKDASLVTSTASFNSAMLKGLLRSKGVHIP